MRRFTRNLGAGAKQLSDQAITPLYFELPFPPSTNNLFVNGRSGRFVSRVYKAWKIEAGHIAKTQAGGRRIAGPYTLAIYLVRPDKRRRDASNYLKACEDLLVWLGITDDDCHCRKVSAEWMDSGPACLVEVRAIAQQEVA